MNDPVRFYPENPGDPVLAAEMRRLGVKAPVENIVHTDWLATALNREKLGPDIRKRIVKLECGHEEVTTNLTRCPCTKCHQLILDGKDYDAFRNHR